jgi:diadenosine tetraphosphate (Ap4A) HIT family hydrolase
MAKGNINEILTVDCGFCNNLEHKMGGATAEFLNAYPKLRDVGQVVEIDKNFILTVDTSPISEDHLLLVTRKHYPSFAAATRDLKPESEDKVREVLSRAEGFFPDKEILIFEHGVGQVEGETIHCGGCGSTDHAHLHILPLEQVGLERVATRLSREIAGRIDLEVSEVNPLPELDFNESGSRPYLYLNSYFGSDENNGYLFVQTSSA